MAFTLRFSEAAGREFDALDGAMQERVRGFLTTAVASTDPSIHFKRLGGNLHGLWKRREGHARLIAEINRGRVRVLVLKIGRRDEVYDVDKAQMKRFAQEIAKP